MSKGSAYESNDQMITEEEKKAIENKDKQLLTKLIQDYITQNNICAEEIYELTQTLQY